MVVMWSAVVGVLLLSNVAARSVSSAQASALCDLIQSTNIYSKFNEWKCTNGHPDTDICSTWTGVTCTAGVIQSIELPSKSIIGYLPETIGNLVGLTKLDLNSNFLSGPIPESVGDLTSLVVLQLQLNKLTGSLPSSLGKLRRASYIQLNGNHITGTIPITFGQLSENLAHLFLNGMSLTGSIPAQIGVLTNLKGLSLDSNSLTGSIPFTLGNLQNIQQFDIHSNLLTGEIPLSLGSLKSCLTFRLDSNSLNGEIPSLLGELAHVITFRVENNHLSHTIPSSLGNIHNVLYLYLQNNQLTGTIPSTFGQLHNLNYLKLNNNQLSGSIPESFTSLQDLFHLHLSNNRLTGDISTGLSLSHMHSLTDVDLSYNRFQGAISEAFCSQSFQSFNIMGNDNLACYPPCAGSMTSWAHSEALVECSASVMVMTSTSTEAPSSEPSSHPSEGAEAVNTVTEELTVEPTADPTQHPSAIPSEMPTEVPSELPSELPTEAPVAENIPEESSTTAPPSEIPTESPVESSVVVEGGEEEGTGASYIVAETSTVEPTTQPSELPTSEPSHEPSVQPVAEPTLDPSREPTFEPSHKPHGHPSHEPSHHPVSRHPSHEPTHKPHHPTHHPTTAQPTSTLEPSTHPHLHYHTHEPSLASLAVETLGHAASQAALAGNPSVTPTRVPSRIPTRAPTSPTKTPVVKATQTTADGPSYLQFYYIDKFGDGWGPARLLIMDSKGSVSMFAPSGRNFMEFGPLLVFDPANYKNGVKVTASIFNPQDRHKWEIGWEVVDNGVIYYGQANTVMTFVYNATTGRIDLVDAESFNLVTEYNTCEPCTSWKDLMEQEKLRKEKRDGQRVNGTYNGTMDGSLGGGGMRKPAVIRGPAGLIEKPVVDALGVVNLVATMQAVNASKHTKPPSTTLLANSINADLVSTVTYDSSTDATSIPSEAGTDSSSEALNESSVSNTGQENEIDSATSNDLSEADLSGTSFRVSDVASESSEQEPWSEYDDIVTEPTSAPAITTASFSEYDDNVGSSEDTEAGNAEVEAEDEEAEAEEELESEEEDEEESDGEGESGESIDRNYYGGVGEGDGSGLYGAEYSINDATNSGGNSHSDSYHESQYAYESPSDTTENGGNSYAYSSGSFAYPDTNTGSSSEEGGGSDSGSVIGEALENYLESKGESSDQIREIIGSVTGFENNTMGLHFISHSHDHKGNDSTHLHNETYDHYGINGLPDAPSLRTRDGRSGQGQSRGGRHDTRNDYDNENIPSVGSGGRRHADVSGAHYVNHRGYSIVSGSEIDWANHTAADTLQTWLAKYGKSHHVPASSSASIISQSLETHRYLDEISYKAGENVPVSVDYGQSAQSENVANIYNKATGYANIRTNSNMKFAQTQSTHETYQPVPQNPSLLPLHDGHVTTTQSSSNSDSQHYTNPSVSTQQQQQQQHYTQTQQQQQHSSQTQVSGSSSHASEPQHSYQSQSSTAAASNQQHSTQAQTGGGYASQPQSTSTSSQSTTAHSTTAGAQVVQPWLAGRPVDSTQKSSGSSSSSSASKSSGTVAAKSSTGGAAPAIVVAKVSASSSSVGAGTGAGSLPIPPALSSVSDQGHVAVSQAVGPHPLPPGPSIDDDEVGFRALHNHATLSPSKSPVSPPVVSSTSSGSDDEDLSELKKALEQKQKEQELIMELKLEQATEKLNSIMKKNEELSKLEKKKDDDHKRPDEKGPVEPNKQGKDDPKVAPKLKNPTKKPTKKPTKRPTSKPTKKPVKPLKPIMEEEPKEEPEPKPPVKHVSKTLKPSLKPVVPAKKENIGVVHHTSVHEEPKKEVKEEVVPPPPHVSLVSSQQSSAKGGPAPKQKSPSTAHPSKKPIVSKVQNSHLSEAHGEETKPKVTPETVTSRETVRETAVHKNPVTTVGSSSGHAPETHQTSGGKWETQLEDTIPAPAVAHKSSGAVAAGKGKSVQIAEEIVHKVKSPQIEEEIEHIHAVIEHELETTSKNSPEHVVVSHPKVSATTKHPTKKPVKHHSITTTTSPTQSKTSEKIVKKKHTHHDDHDIVAPVAHGSEKVGSWEGVGGHGGIGNSSSSYNETWNSTESGSSGGSSGTPSGGNGENPLMTAEPTVEPTTEARGISDTSEPTVEPTSEPTVNFSGDATTVDGDTPSPSGIPTSQTQFLSFSALDEYSYEQQDEEEDLEDEGVYTEADELDEAFDTASEMDMNMEAEEDTAEPSLSPIHMSDAVNWPDITDMIEARERSDGGSDSEAVLSDRFKSTDPLLEEEVGRHEGRERDVIIDADPVLDFDSTHTHPATSSVIASHSTPSSTTAHTKSQAQSQPQTKAQSQPQTKAQSQPQSKPESHSQKQTQTQSRPEVSKNTPMTKSQETSRHESIPQPAQKSSAIYRRENPATISRASTTKASPSSSTYSKTKEGDESSVWVNDEMEDEVEVEELSSPAADSKKKKTNNNYNNNNNKILSDHSKKQQAIPRSRSDTDDDLDDDTILYAKKLIRKNKVRSIEQELERSFDALKPNPPPPRTIPTEEPTSKPIAVKKKPAPKPTSEPTAKPVSKAKPKKKIVTQEPTSEPSEEPTSQKPKRKGPKLLPSKPTSDPTSQPVAKPPMQAQTSISISTNNINSGKTSITVITNDKDEAKKKSSARKKAINKDDNDDDDDVDEDDDDEHKKKKHQSKRKKMASNRKKGLRHFNRGGKDEPVDRIGPDGKLQPEEFDQDYYYYYYNDDDDDRRYRRRHSHYYKPKPKPKPEPKSVEPTVTPTAKPTEAEIPTYGCLKFWLGDTQNVSWAKSDGFGTEYFITDDEGRDLIDSGSYCSNATDFDPSGRKRNRTRDDERYCGICLNDGEYYWRVTGAMLNSTVSGVAWEFCDVTGGAQTELQFTIEHGRCIPGKVTLAQNALQAVYQQRDLERTVSLEGFFLIAGVLHQVLNDDDTILLQDSVAQELNMVLTNPKTPGSVLARDVKITQFHHDLTSELIPTKLIEMKKKRALVEDVSVNNHEIGVQFSASIPVEHFGLNSRDPEEMTALRSKVEKHLNHEINSGSFLVKLKYSAKLRKNKNFQYLSSINYDSHVVVNKVEEVAQLAEKGDVFSMVIILATVLIFIGVGVVLAYNIRNSVPATLPFLHSQKLSASKEEMFRSSVMKGFELDGLDMDMRKLNTVGIHYHLSPGNIHNSPQMTNIHKSSETSNNSNRISKSME